MKDVLTEAMDIEGLERVLGGIASGEIKCPSGRYANSVAIRARNFKRQSLRISG